LKSEELLILEDKSTGTGNTKSTARVPYRGVKKDKIAFHLATVVPGEPSSPGEPPPCEPSASDVNLKSSTKRPRRRQRKKKKAPSSQEPLAPIPAAPSNVVSAIATEVMDTWEDDAATTTSATSHRSYASVVVTQVSSSAALPISTDVNSATDFPSSVTASGESSTYLSEIAALKRENDKLKAQLAKQPRVPKAVTSIVVSEFSDPSSLTDSTPDVDLDAYSVMSPPRKLRRMKTPVHTPPSSSNRSQPP
jgi:hypothetical protein